MPEPVVTVREPRTTSVRDAIGGLFAVVAAAARIWWGYWPLLLTIALLGGAVRMGAIWAATVLSGLNNTLGVAVLVLAPLGAVGSIVLMLHVLRHATPDLSGAASQTATEDVTTRRERRVVDILASVLVPFLAVYASYGLLAEDSYRYRNAILGEEFVNNADIFFSSGDAIDGDRFFFATGWLAVGIVLAAVVLRWGLARLERQISAPGGRRPRGLAFAGAYVEVFWMVTLAAHFVLYKEQLWAWAESRRAIVIVTDWWQGVLDRLGPLAGPVDAVVAWGVDVVSSVDGLVVVPLAWLTVGAVVYGHKLAAPPTRTLKVPLVERLPAPVRRWGGELVSQVVGDLRSRFNGLVGGIRQLAVAGLGPMLVFSLAFLLAARLEEALAMVVRGAVGPRDLNTWLAFTPHLETLTRAVGLTVTMSLLAAAVDRVLGAQSTAIEAQSTASEA